MLCLLKYPVVPYLNHHGYSNNDQHPNITSIRVYIIVVMGTQLSNTQWIHAIGQYWSDIIIYFNTSSQRVKVKQSGNNVYRYAA